MGITKPADNTKQKTKTKEEKVMYIIKNGRVHIGNGTILEHCDILIRGSKIEKVAENIIEPAAEIIDAAGKEVFPGFIDPHSAIGAMGIPTRHLDTDEIHQPVTAAMNIKYSIDPDEVNAQEFYKSGITTIGCTPGNYNIFGGQIAAFKTAPQKMALRLVKEQAALKCSVEAGVKQVFGGRKQAPMTRMGILQMFENTIGDARREKEKTDHQKVICQVFDEKKMPLFVAAETKGEMDSLLHILKEEKVEKVIIDGFCFGDCVEEMKAQNVGLILGNVNALSQILKHGMKMEKLVELAENGNLIAFTNTCSGSSEGREVFIWTAIEAYRAGVDAEKVVEMMTLSPAKMLGIADRVGTIEEGKDADISIFSGHPVTTYAAKVERSIINGEVVM